MGQFLYIFVLIPIGIPHRVIKEDIYEGYRIPVGSLVIANIWCGC